MPLLKKIDRILSKIEPPNWVLAILGIVFLARIPSLFSPYYYGDEMIYLVLGNAIKKGLTLYSQIHDNKPPLIYILGAISGNLFWFKALLLFWMLATIVIFWHLTKALFDKNKRARQIAIITFSIFTTIPIFEGQIINAELLLIGPLMLGFLLLLKNQTYKNFIFAGIMFAVAILFKVPAIFDVPVIIIYWFISSQNRIDIKIITKRSLIILVSLSAPILLTFLWFFLKGGAVDYIKAAFLQNIGYLSSWSGGQSQPFLVKNGPLIMKGFVVLISFVLLFVYRNKLTKPFTVATIWLATSLFAATLSGRPYPHYLIQVIPSISILIGILFASKKFEQVLTIFPLTMFLLTIVYYKFWYYPTVPYYQNFISYATGRESKEVFYNHFDSNTATNYATAQEIVSMTNPSNKIFVWGEEAPTIYALTKRLPPIKYVANYHITDFSTLQEVANELSQNPPTLIVFLPHSPTYPELSNLLTKKYVLINRTSDRAEIWHLVTEIE